VVNAYGGERFSFGPEYIIPKPFDARVLTREAVAVAKAAVETGVAREPITDWDEYAAGLERRILGKAHQVTRSLQAKARRTGTKRIVLPDSGEEKVLRAATMLADEGIARPVLVGKPDGDQCAGGVAGHRTGRRGDLDPRPRLDAYAEELYRLRQRRGVTPSTARQLLRDPAYIGVMMVHSGDADGLVSGLNRSYPDTIRPALEIIRLRPGCLASGGPVLHGRARARALLRRRDRQHRSDGRTARRDRGGGSGHCRGYFDIEPRVAMLSFGNFGSVDHPYAQKMARATEVARRLRPDLIVDGEMAPDTALLPEIVEANFPHSRIRGDANVLIFPNVQSGNISLKLVQRLAGADIIGPILMGLNQPVNALNYYAIGAGDREHRDDHGHHGGRRSATEPGAWVVPRGVRMHYPRGHPIRRNTMPRAAILLLTAACTVCTACASTRVEPLHMLPAGAVDAPARLDTSPRHGEWAMIPVAGGDSIRAWVVYPERSTPAPVVLVVHEIYGVTHWIRAVADQLAAEGFIAIAPDLMTAANVPVGPDGDPVRDQATAAIRALDPAVYQPQLQTIAEWGMALPAATDRYGIVGFCWGGRRRSHTPRCRRRSARPSSTTAVHRRRSGWPASARRCSACTQATTRA
jgi:phosphotransacetylase